MLDAQFPKWGNSFAFPLVARGASRYRRKAAKLFWPMRTIVLDALSGFEFDVLNFGHGSLIESTNRALVAAIN